MIPIAIEPTRLAYGLSCSMKGCSATSGEELINFVRGGMALYEELKRLDLGVAMTPDLMQECDRQFPYQAVASEEYSSAVRAVMSQAMRAFQLKRERWRVVHEYGQHEKEVTIAAGVSDSMGMLANDELYLHWQDMLGLILMGNLPPFILNGADATVFCADQCTIQTTSSPKEDVTVHVSPDLGSECSNRGLALWRLAHLIRNEGQSAQERVPCSGTGTHSSMWKRSVRSLGDVPEPERVLLEDIAALGIVKEYRLLDYDSPDSPTKSPEIKSLQVKNEYVLMGRLHGAGKNQNAQEIEIHLRLDCATQLKAAMGDSIDAPKLSQVRGAMQQLRLKGGK